MKRGIEEKAWTVRIVTSGWKVWRSERERGTEVRCLVSTTARNVLVARKVPSSRGEGGWLVGLAKAARIAAFEELHFAINAI